MKKILYISAIILFIVCSLFFTVFQELSFYSKEPILAHGKPQIFQISSGQTFDLIIRNLHEEKIINHPLKFKLLARIKGVDRSIKAGEYLLSSSMTPEKILETIGKGKVHLYKITIPEGYTMDQIASLLEESGLVKGSEFLEAAKDLMFTEQLGIKAESFEGYLFPDTYFFSKGVSVRKVIETMVKQFHEIFTPMWKKRSSEMAFSIHEVVTLASIIEKETGISEERPIVSSVFHNRMKQNMPLQSDPTVIYGIQDFDGNLTRQHLNTPTPYNTYTISGLPPGPIANPGKASLESALFPAKSAYLYFVSKNDKTHFFSTNHDEHSKAVKKYQLNQ